MHKLVRLSRGATRFRGLFNRRPASRSGEAERSELGILKRTFTIRNVVGGDLEFKSVRIGKID